MPDSGWRIEQACPQCGGPVLLEETDRLLACPYCRVRLYITCDGFFRYLLPPRRATAEELLFVPYWRFKGQVFSCVPFEVKSGLVDMSSCAAELPGAPQSLGVRTQTVNLRFASKETPGTFLRTTVEEGAAVAACRRLYNAWNDTELLHQAFVGEEVSIVYLPVAVREALYDAVAERRIAPLPIDRLDRDRLIDPIESPSVRFLPTLCPGCGWDLEGARDSLALLCRNCRSVWVARGGRLERLEFGVIGGDFEPDLYLPFWRIKPSTRGVDLRSYADLVRFANLPKVIRPEWEVQELYLWTPAFKVHPRYFMRIATTVTIGQPTELWEERLPDRTLYPVTLPAAESADSLKVLLAEFARPKSRLFPKLAQIEIDVEEARLVFVPFRANAREVRNAGVKTCIQQNLLAYGKNL